MIVWKRYKAEILLFVCLLFKTTGVQAQSFELMPGNERIFIDAQYLAFIDADAKWSLFSRARATSTYTDSETDLFTGGYLNYTTRSGFGGTLVGRISSKTAGVDAGIHFFKANQRFVIYALPSVRMYDVLNWSWFSILRWTPVLSADWRWYTSLELFSAFDSGVHLGSVQRIRIGVQKEKYQFGFGTNLNQRGRSWNGQDPNIGGFIRLQF